MLRPLHPAARSRRERIVVIKLDRIGDFVLATPFLRELRRAKPEAWITLVTSQTVSDLALHCPYVDELVIAPKTLPGLHSEVTHWRSWQRIALKKLQPLRATLAILPRWDVDLYDAFALLSLCGARDRVSYSVAVDPFKRQQNSGYDHFLTRAVGSKSGRHEVEKNLALLTALGLPHQRTNVELWPIANADALLNRLFPQREKHRLVALCPLSAEEVKDWPLQRFLQVAEHFRHVPALTFVLLVGPEYAAISERADILAQTNLISLAGKLTLDETAALLGRCELALTVDTGLMHIAAAMHCPLVVVSMLAAGTNPESHYSPDRFGPWEADCTLVAPVDATSSPRRIDTITVEQVVNAVAARLHLQ